MAYGNTDTLRKTGRMGKGRRTFKRQWTLFAMLLLPALFTLVFAYGPMAGLIMAFQDYLPNQGWYVFGSQYVGLANFERLFADPQVWNVLKNTVVIAIAKIVTGMVFPIGIAILMNEIGKTWFKRTVQTVIFLPYFISWVIMSGLLTSLFSMDGGMLTRVVGAIGLKMPDFFADPAAFPWMLIFSNLWKDAGYGAIVFLAAITTVDPTLYEAARMDGAGYFKRCIHVTLPGMVPIIVLMTVLNMGNILNAGFEQVFNLYHDVVYKTGDILDTYIYRLAFGSAQDYSFAAAVGLFKSIVSTVFIATAYIVAYKKFDYKIF